MPQLLPSSNSHPADSVFPSSLRKSKQMKQNFHKHLTRHLCHFLRPLLYCYELTRTPANPLTENLLCIVAVSNLSPPILFWTFWLCPHESTETTLVNNTCDLHDPKSMVLCLHLTCPIISILHSGWLPLLWYIFFSWLRGYQPPSLGFPCTSLTTFSLFFAGASVYPQHLNKGVPQRLDIGPLLFWVYLHSQVYHSNFNSNVYI